MAISLKHSKVSDKSDGQDDSLLQPSHWNAEHNFVVPAKRLVGNSDDAEAGAEDISVGSGLELTDGQLQFGGADSQVVVSVTDPDLPGARAVTDTATITWEKPGSPNEDQIKANVADRSITLAKMQAGTEAQVFYYGASGVPTRLAPGAKGTVLVSGVASAVGPPVVPFAAPVWGFAGAPHVVLRDEKPNGTDGGKITSGTWKDRTLNKELYDTYDFATLTDATTTNISFTLVAGTYVIEWSAPAYRVNRHQTRLFNSTDSIVLGHGTPEYSTTVSNSQTRSTGIANFTVEESKVLKVQHRCGADTDENLNLGVGAGLDDSPEIYTVVKIWRVA